MQSEPRNARIPVWALSISLAATLEIEFSFFSSGYLDVSVHRVPSVYLWIQYTVTEVCSAGFPHSEIAGSMDICSSPTLIAAYHVFHRLLVPRHPPCALISLTKCDESLTVHSVAPFGWFLGLFVSESFDSASDVLSLYWFYLDLLSSTVIKCFAFANLDKHPLVLCSKLKASFPFVRKTRYNNICLDSIFGFQRTIWLRFFSH